MERIVVQKFGGTSLNNRENREKAATHVADCRKAGDRPVVVVSAGGRAGDPYSTDSLLGLIKKDFSFQLPREQDLLLSCGEIISACRMAYTLTANGYQAVALTGAQAGIFTNGVFTDSQVIHVDTEPTLQLLREDIIPIITGFQGISVEGEITTLGRGGSDTSAAVIASALQAERLEIFTDVAGVMSADPSIVEAADFLQEMDYEDLFELAIQGARIVHPRAAEIARKAGIPIQIRSTFTGEQKTTIQHVKADKPIISIVNRNQIAYVKIIPEDPSAYQHALKVFGYLSENNLSVDFIDIRPEAITFVVDEYHMLQVADVLDEKEIDCQVSIDYSMVSIVGAGMTGRPGIMATIVQTLQKEQIEIYQTTDSHSSISVLISREDEKKAVNSLHQAFDL